MRRAPHAAPPSRAPRACARFAAALLPVALLAPARATGAQGPPAPAPGAAAAPADSLAAALARRVDPVFAQWSSPDSPGCVVGVRQGERVVLEKGYGMADLEHDVPMSPATVSEAGSVTKQVVAMTALLLERDGTLSLDDDVRRWIPELPDYAARYGGRRITLRQLVQHTSGVRDHWTLTALVHPRDASVVQTRADVLDLLVRQRALNFAPGTQFLYSNGGYTLLALALERASGQPLGDLVAARVFRPLGMTRTGFRDDRSRIVKGRAIGYAPGPTGGWRTLMPEYDVVGSGGMLTTVGDLLRWERNFDLATVGGPALVARMTEGAVLEDGRRLPYAYGVVNARHRGAPVVSHTGATAAYRAALHRFPAQRAAIALLCNHATANTALLAERVADAVLGDAFPEPASAAVASGPAPTAARAAADRPVGAPERGLVAAAAGAWADSLTGTLLVLRADGGELLAERGARADTLVWQGDGRWLAPGGRRIALPARSAHPPEALLVTEGDDPPVSLRRVPPAPVGEGARRAHAALAGHWVADELGGVTWTLVAAGAGDALVLRRRHFADLALRPLHADAWSDPAGGLVVRVARDPAGAPAALLVSNGRTRDVRFVRAGGAAGAEGR